MILNSLAEYLEDNGVGVVNTNIWIGELPFDIDDCIGITYSSSPEPNKSIPYFTQVVDVWSRYVDYETGFSKMKQIFDLLHRKENFEISGFHIYIAYASGMIDDLDRDAERRHLFKLTLVFIYREAVVFS